MERCEVVVSNAAFETILDIKSKTDLAKVRKRLETLALAPEMGVTYDPVYDAARPDHDVLVTYVGRWGIYYCFDEEARRVEVEFVCDERTDPRRRFAQPWGSVDDVVS